MTYSPWRHVGAMPDIEVWTGDVLLHADAYWEPDERVILIDRRLGQAARRSKLAHELAHIEAGDFCCTVGPDADRLNGRQERKANEIAARRLITLCDLADALIWALDPREVAEVLHVDASTVRARIRSLTAAEKQFIEDHIATREGAA